MGPFVCGSHYRRKGFHHARKLPSYCLHKPSGQANVTLRVDGKRKVIYLGVYNSRESLEKYDRVVGDWLAKRPVVDTDSLTVRDVAERYQSYLDEDRHAVDRAMSLLIELFGPRPCNEFDAVLFHRYRTELRQRDFSRKYANEIISWVKRCFKWAFQRRHISSGQYLSVDSIAPLTADEAPTKVVSCGSCHGCPRRL